MSKKVFEVGSQVKWNWMGLVVKGSVKKVYYKPVEREFRGTTYKRNGSKEKPAYLVRSLAGHDVLKSHSELSRG